MSLLVAIYIIRDNSCGFVVNDAETDCKYFQEQFGQR